MSESCQDRLWGQESDGLIGGPLGHLGCGATHSMGQPRRSESDSVGAAASSSPPGRLPCPTRASLHICITRAVSCPHQSMAGGGWGRSDSALCLSMKSGGLAGVGQRSLHMPGVRGRGVCLNQVPLVLGRTPIPASAPRGSPSCWQVLGPREIMSHFIKCHSHVTNYCWKWGHTIPSDPGLPPIPCN